MSVLTEDKYNVIYTENCLIVNIYVPETRKIDLPVVVYIHGGAFQIGFGEMMSPSLLVETGKVIAVTLNYRLGVQGFLCLGTEDIPGNAGLKDQLAALRWVRDNISRFGGNPNDVTLAGASAGSGAVELLMLSESARGLFNKVISESGSVLSPWGIQTDPIGNAKRLALMHDFKNVHNISELENFYKTTSVEVFQSSGFMHLKDSTFELVPCVERSMRSGENVILDAPISILKKGSFNKVPMLVGFAKNEGMLRIPIFDTWSDEMNENFKSFVPADLTFKSSKEKEKVAEEIKRYYFDNKAINIKTIANYIDYFSDVMFKHPTLELVKLNLKKGAKNIYLYEFSYIDETQPIEHNFSGSNHCAQTAILTTRNLFINNINKSEKHKKMKNMMIDLWTKFITTGKPVEEKSTLFPLGWPAISFNNPVYMELDVVPKLGKNLLENTMEFWDRIYEKYYSTPIQPGASPTIRTEL